MAKDYFHEIEISEPAPEGTRDSVGGCPILKAGQDVPTCKLCDQPMMLFLQLDLREPFGLGFAPGSHLLLFGCREHNECAQGEPVPQQEHYAIILNPPGGEDVHAKPDHILENRALTFTRREEAVEENEYLKSGEVGTYGFKVGGTPGWINFDHFDPSFSSNCNFCDAPYEFILQIPDYTDLPKQASAPEQPHGSSSKAYQWLLGNFCYVLGCSAQCNPRAQIVINDN